MSPQAGRLSGPCSRIAISPAMTRPRTVVMSASPPQSMPPLDSPGASSMPNQMTTRHAVTTTAGSISSTVIDVDSTRAPEVSAPMMTAVSRAPTRMPAARRVSSACRPVPAVRRWMIATSSGSHTTYAPWSAQPMRNVVNDGANARIHEPRAVTAVEISSTFLWPIRSPSRARNGTTRAETISCAASNQLTSASAIPRWSAMSLKIGV